MAEQNFLKDMEELGFGGAEPSPLTATVSDLALKAARKQAEAEREDLGFWEMVGMRQLDAGTIFSATALLDRPEAGEQEALTDEIIEELTGGITDERAITRILEAAGSKGVNYGRAIAREVRQTIETNQALSEQGLTGAAAMLFSDVLDPADAAIMAATAAGVSAAAPPLAPVTAPVAAAGAKGYRLFSKFKNNKKYLAMAAGVGGTELAALELLRSQSKYDITGGDIILAGTIGAAGGAGFTKLGQVMYRRSVVQQALRKQADGEPLTATETAILRQNDDEILAQKFRQMAHDNDDFGVDELAEITGGSGLTRKDFTQMTPEELAAVPRQRGVGAGVRGFLSAFVETKNSDDGIVRWLGDGLGLNSTGNKVGADGRVTAVNFGALEQRDTLVMRYRLSIANPIKELREQYISRTNISQADWNVLVSRQLRMPNPAADPAVVKAANIYKTKMKELAQQAVDANVAGFDVGTISRIQNYAPRIFNRGNIRRLREGTLKDNADGSLNAAWGQLAEAAIRRGQPNIETTVKKALEKKRKGKAVSAKMVKDYITRISNGYIKGVLDPSYNQRSNAKMANGDFDVEDFTNVMKAEGFGDDDIELILDVLTADAKVKGHKRALPRMILDEATEITVTGSDGKPFQLRFHNLLEENMENLFDSYVFQLSGSIGLARNGIDTNEVGSSFETIISKISNQGDAARQKEIESLRYMYESTNGRFAYRSDLTETQKQTLRRVRELSFMANMGMSGMAAIMELSNAIFEYSFSTLIKTVPMYGKLIRDSRTGQLSSRVAREMEAATGVGGDGIVSKVTTMRSRLEGDVSEGIQIDGEITKFDELLGKGRIFTSIASGLQGVTDVLRRVTLYNYASEWAYAHKAGKVAMSPIKREQLGITDEMAQRIRNQIDEHADYLPDGTLNGLNADRWTDSDAADIFFASARREATQAVQEMNAGSVNARLRGEVGKSFFQFLSFPMASMEQQAMRLGVRFANGDQMQVAKIMSFSMMLGSMMYMSRSYLNSMGRSDQEEYMKRRMETANLLQGALSQIGAASLFGYIYQLTTGAMDGNTNALTPAGVSMGIGAIKGAGDMWDALGEGELSETELRSLLRIFPFTSLYGVRQILNATANAATN
jgi:hypothetical protein